MLTAGDGREEAALDANGIRVANWNIQKARDTDSYDEFVALAERTDLILIQEATLASGMLQPLQANKFWSFAPGYRRGGKLSGVITMSATMPLTRCNLTAYEPWLRTPKATSVTEYALSGTQQTLVVVNIHAINFTLGVRRFRDQIEQVATVLDGHSGPVLLSGDFNTWRLGRQRIVSRVTKRLGLEAVPFADDRRKRVFGHVLDHIYVRGLRHADAQTRQVSSSDHNPMTVRLSRDTAGE